MRNETLKLSNTPLKNQKVSLSQKMEKKSSKKSEIGQLSLAQAGYRETFWWDTDDDKLDKWGKMWRDVNDKALGNPNEFLPDMGNFSELI